MSFIYITEIECIGCVQLISCTECFDDLNQVNWFCFDYYDLMVIIFFLLIYTFTNPKSCLVQKVYGPNACLESIPVKETSFRLDSGRNRRRPTFSPPELHLSVERRVASSAEKYKPCFYVDSEATQHMCNDLFVMRNCRPASIDILTGKDDGIVKGTSLGTVILTPNSQYKVGKPILLRSTIYSSALRHNILSIKSLEKEGYTFVFRKGRCTIYDDKDKVVARAWIDHTGLYKIDSRISFPKAPISVAAAANIMGF